MSEGIRARTFQRSSGTERYIIVVNNDVNNNQSTNLKFIGTENKYDLTTLKMINSNQLFNHVLLAGRGNLYLVGSEEDFNYYLTHYGGYNVGYNVNDNDDDTNSIKSTIYSLFIIFYC